MATRFALIRAVIVDDEALARSRLRRLLGEHRDVRVVGEHDCAAEAVDAILAVRPDLVFLDIEMPGMDGFEVLEAISAEYRPAVVFVTAFGAYAHRAFDFEAVDYVLKPFDRDRLARALDRVRSRRQGLDQEVQARLLGLLESFDGKRTFVDQVALRHDGRIVLLRTAEIDWVEASGNYVRIHARGTTHTMRSTLAAFQERLDPDRFLRIHRSIVVNLDRVREITPWFHGDYAVILRDGERLSLSRTYRPQVERLLT